MKLASNTGMLLLGIWLIAFGALPLLNINFANREQMLQILAIGAGAFILMNK